MADPSIAEFARADIGFNVGFAEVTFASAPTAAQRVIIMCNGTGNTSLAPGTGTNGFTAENTIYSQLTNPFQQMAVKVWELQGDGAQATFRIEWTSNVFGGTIFGFAIDNGDACDVVGTESDVGFDTTPTIPGVTTLIDGALVFSCLFHVDQSATDAPHTDLSGSGWTIHETNPSDNNNETVVYTKNIATAGASGSLNVTCPDGGRGSDTAFAVSFSIPPAPPSVATYEQEGYRFRNDDGSETTATWKASQDTDISIAKETPFRLRMLVNTGDADPTSSGLKLQYRKVGDTSWSDVL